MSAGSSVLFDDNEIAVFAKSQFPDVNFDHVKRHDVDDTHRLYRMGQGDEDDLLHLLVDPAGQYMAYLPNLSGAMKNVGSGSIR